MYIDWLCIQQALVDKLEPLSLKKGKLEFDSLHPMTNSIYFGTQLCYEEASHKKQKKRSVMGVETATQGP